MSHNEIRVVLVHGAWADGSSWSKVISGLESKGVKAVTVPVPLTSLADDVQAVERTLDHVGGAVVLVGHAYAGGVIGSTRDARVRGLVYIAALAPDEGETVADVFYRGEPHALAPTLAPDPNGLIWLPEDAFAKAFAPHATAQEQAVLAAIQRPISPACITVPVGRPLWKDLPSWYMLAEQDRMIVAANQRFMAERMQARVRELPVDHTPSVTAPDAVVDLILDAVRAVGA